MVSQVSRSRLRAFGMLLRKLRNRAGLKLSDVARDVGVSVATLSRIELGTTSISDTATLARMIALLGATVDEAEELITLREEASQPNWVDAQAPRHLGTLIDYEHSAHRITSVTHTLIPGLLQTWEYADAVFRICEVPGREALVERRLGRQTLLTETSVDLVAIISEAALLHAIGGPEVAAGQLRHLLASMTKPNITVQIMPLDRYDLATLSAGYVLLEFHDQPPIVHIEHPTGAAFIDQPDAMKQYQAITARLRTTAADSAQSAELIQEALWRIDDR